MTSPGALNLIETLAEERTRGIGRLCVTRDERRVQLPLAGVRIAARVADRVAQVTMDQTFQNPYTEPLEATYIFPLGGGSAVSAFELKVGGRTIKGIVKERDEARRTYQKAIEDGKRAALLEQERDDVFTVQVGNLPPGEQVSVRIVYSEKLPYFDDGTTELRLPLVVAPRYIPGQPLPRDPVGQGVEWDTDQVPDASRLTPPRLADGFDPKVALSIEVALADGDLADLACSQHATRLSDGKIALARQDELLNRDFVLRWRLAKDSVRSTLLVTKDGYGMLSIAPPRQDGFLGVARDVVFILDRSGSMEGVKMTSAARACSILLATLGPRDRFGIVAFDDSTEWFGRELVRADEAGLAAGDKFLRGIGARGGTELDPALAETLAAIRTRAEQRGRVPVIVIITDGQVGNESEILKRVQKELGDARVFTVGIDTAVNEAFLKRLSAVGGGTCTCCVPGEALEEALSSVGREIGTPLVVDVQIEGADCVAPARIPDLFAGRATTAFFVGKNIKSVRVRGKRADGGTFDETVQAREIELPAIGHLWARTRVADLEDRFRMGEDVRQQIIDIALRHTLLTRFTAFVVVDESEIVNKDGQGRTVVQPVHMPDRWEMQKREQEATRCFAAAMPAESEAPEAMLPHALGDVSCELPCPPPAPKSKPSGVLRSFKEAFRRRPKKSDDAKAVKAERAAIEPLIDALAKALAAVKSALDVGVVPSAGPLEKARTALIDALAASALGAELAGLQKFLRQGLVELIAALQAPGATAASLSPVFERHAKSFEETRREVGGAKFWEATV